MARGDLTSTEWAIIGPLLPPERGRLARPALDNRRFEIVDRAVLSLKDAGSLPFWSASAARLGMLKWATPLIATI